MHNLLIIFFLIAYEDVHTVDVGMKIVNGIETQELALRVHTTCKKPLHYVPKVCT
jgi:hypothetical protein